MAKAGQQQRGGTPQRLTVTVKGPKVGPARLSAADLAEIVKRTQQALKRVGRVLYGQEEPAEDGDGEDVEGDGGANHQPHRPAMPEPTIT